MDNIQRENYTSKTVAEYFKLISFTASLSLKEVGSEWKIIIYLLHCLIVGSINLRYYMYVKSVKSTLVILLHTLKLVSKTNVIKQHLRNTACYLQCQQNIFIHFYFIQTFSNLEKLRWYEDCKQKNIKNLIHDYLHEISVQLYFIY